MLVNKLLSMPWKLYVIQLIAGALLGLLVLHPFSMLVSWCQFDELQNRYSLKQWMRRELGEELNRGHFIHADLAYMSFGAFLTTFATFFYRSQLRRKYAIRQLTSYLDENVLMLIEQGESEHLEFKSSLRWDYAKNQINRSLEKVILKSIAGFMNVHGGTLLIGIEDHGTVLGLKNDYQNTKKKNRDGFELVLTDLVSSRLGADLCTRLGIFFHSVSGNDVCRVIVERSLRPAYLIEGGNSEFYVRTGNGTRALDVQEAVEYIRNRF